ncbi:MAG: ABC-F family ATP-binding cassette domain-containing protein [Proteobacteria bacterium]|nr:ABC-F family ATP-binding cassette domain-containing protein [Pseudomonadota bacterium]MBU1710438.1 ABC-F family ATP-binding cassette domain-containing protein [Pseudomonadota bacterium]
MIIINDLNLQYGNKYIFKELSARIGEQDRIGLVGVNGTGKSTLLKIIAGIQETDFGVVTRSRHATIGYLPQEITAFPSGRSLYEEAESAFGNIIEMQNRLEEINLRLSSEDSGSAGYSLLLVEQGELQHELERADIFRMKSQVETVLSGLGFSEADLSKDCTTFSGGWTMRLMLAKHLLAKPSFLLLDEPTNHLDIESLTWLESFLTTYQGAMIIISHDRAFLDNMTSATWELSRGTLTAYKGNYTKYLVEKELRMQVQRAAYENQQAQIQQTMRFVERFRAKSTKAKQVQSRVKQLAKLDRIELEDSESTISFRFPPALPSGRLALEVKGLTKSYNNKNVFTDISFELQRGEKIAVVGVNGAGKSTMVRLLAAEITPDKDTIRLGHNVKTSYFGQHQAQDLPQNLTVLQTLSEVEGDRSVTQDRSILGAFLFRGDDVDKKVSILSGGEKSRLALAKMIITPANLLIMDEPTNHLDMMSQEILQEAMKQYDGTIIVVSHNRYFVDQFVNKVLEIKDGKATLFDGNVSYYLEKTRESRKVSLLPGKPQSEAVQSTDAAPARGRNARQAQAQIRIDKNKILRPLKIQADEAEKEIEKYEARKSLVESYLADPELYKDQDAFADKSREYKEVGRRLERLYATWEETQARIEEAEKSFGQDAL